MTKKYSSERLQLPVAKLTIPFSVADGTMHLRLALGEVKLPDEIKVELSTCPTSGHIIVTINPPGDGWRTYSLSPDALIEAVLRAEGIYPGDETFSETRPENGE